MLNNLDEISKEGKNMLRKMNLQTKLMSSFFFMGFIVLIVAIIGWIGTQRLHSHFYTLSDNSLPSVIALWKINEGQTQIESSERILLDPNMTASEREKNLTRIENAWVQINEGFEQYEKTNQTEEEKRRYEQMLIDWRAWQKAHEEFIEVESEYAEIGIRNPWQIRGELQGQDRLNSPEAARVQRAFELRNQLDEVQAEESRLFQTATDSILGVLEINENVAEAAKLSAETDLRNSTFWVTVGMILGPLTAIILGIFLSRAIARPIDRTLSGIVNAIVSSSSQIAATVQEQERIATQQASSVSQTTTTMDELGASSRQSAEQAESASNSARQVLQMAQEGAENARQALQLAEESTNGARQVLILSEEGIKVVGKTLEGISTLQDKVRALAERILRLSEQIAQIGTITNLVSDIANQTNMLALNAAVEAVRAGEHGRGFAVVASEIRKLADQSKTSAEKINLLVVDIKTAIQSTVSVTEEGTQKAAQGIVLSQETAEAFNGVNNAINSIVLKNQELTVQAINDAVLRNQEVTLTALNDVVIKNQQIALTAKQQAVAVEEVVGAMNVINSGSQQTATGISQTHVGIQKLNEAAQNIKALSSA